MAVMAKAELLTVYPDDPSDEFMDALCEYGLSIPHDELLAWLNKPETEAWRLKNIDRISEWAVKSIRE